MFEPNRQQYGLPVAAGEFVPARKLGYGGYHAHEAEPAEPFDPLKLLFYLVHYRWMIAALLTAGIVAGVLFTWIQTPLYRATATVEIMTQGAKVMQEFEVVSPVDDWRVFETARQKIMSRDLSRRVAYELNLAGNDDFLAPTPRFSLINLVNRASGGSSQAGLEELSAETREAMAAGRVKGGLSVTNITDTNILAVSYSHPEPQIAALVANQVARSFIDQGVDKRSETSDLARQFVEERVRDTKEKLQASEEALVNYAKSAGITVTGTDASLISDNISDINKALAEAIQERLTAERYQLQVKEGNASSLPQVFESESIQQTKQKVAELKATYQEKLSTLKPGFPEMVRLLAQIGELQKQMNSEVSAIARSVEIIYQQALEKEVALKKELTSLEARQAEFQDKNIQYTILKREVDSNRAQYESLIGKLNEVGAGSEIRNSNASIIDEAVAPGGPYSPRLYINLAAALALCGALAAALIYLLELLNNTFSVPDQIESELKLPVLGIIPRASEAEIAEAFMDSKSALSEAYRSLRTSLQFTGAEGNMRTLTVTSSAPSEGKSTTAFKLAHDFAALGKKVLVIDADLRRPRMHRLFNTDNTIGLSNLLSNVVRQGDVTTIFRETADKNVTFMSAGTIPPNPADLLTSQRMAMTLHYCAKKYGLVIIDCPPVMGLSDAPILSRQTDATLLVVAAKQVTRKAAKNALARLRAAGGHVVGATLTKFTVNQLDRHYSYMQYDYHYDSARRQLENHGEPTTAKSGFGGKAAAALSGMLGRRRGANA